MRDFEVPVTVRRQLVDEVSTGYVADKQAHVEDRVQPANHTHVPVYVP